MEVLIGIRKQKVVKTVSDFGKRKVTSHCGAMSRHPLGQAIRGGERVASGGCSQDGFIFCVAPDSSIKNLMGRLML